MKKNKIYIGSSGFYYEHWKNRFYPKDVKPKGYFEYYQKYFNTVEINNTFYKLPSKKVILHWKNEANKDFIFSLKASRFITHIKRLKEPKKHITLFLNRVKHLKPHLGPILFQIPPNWHLDIKRLENFLKTLDKNYKYAFEFRDKSWLTKPVSSLLKKYEKAFCIYNLEGFQTPLEITANFVYIRLHGPKKAYSGSYSKIALQKWAKIIKNFQKDKLDVFCYFNNDERAYAIKNALELKKLLKA
ncbi:hypothetical protein LCGC14_1913360 [marine sediment metagenome]|uniref:DUF72 domain-containing protein n=1 Tax=marine sediment metagenome TaxID=412755 RepID=A0A0F9GG59_9ZZZZ|nr:hypothetical protein [Candidatus Anoxychlamydiales bacterium]